MASISSKLAPKDKQALATFYETEAYKSFLKLMALVKDNAGKQAINAMNFENVKYLQGQHVAVELLEKEFEKIHEWSQKH